MKHLNKIYKYYLSIKKAFYHQNIYCEIEKILPKYSKIFSQRTLFDNINKIIETCVNYF